MVLEPPFNAQNSSGVPQSNKQNVKYPFYLQGTAGNTYGVPTMISTDTPIYNFTDELGFFTGSVGSYSAITTSAFTITSEYIVDMSDCVSGNTIDLTYDGSCSPSTGTPEENQFITFIFDGNGGCGDIGNYPILTYKIQSVTGITSPFTIELDRNLPDFLNQGCLGNARALIYPSGITPFYDSVTPQDYFCSDCSTGSTVDVWNMNIPWSESPAGIFPNINEDYTKYGSVNYLGTKEYLGYQTNEGQVFQNSSGTTAQTDTWYYNSYDEKIDVLPSQQKAIVIVHYTNQSVVNYYGEKFAFEPFDSANPTEAGYARNFKVTLPTLMWHKSTGTTI